MFRPNIGLAPANRIIRSIAPVGMSQLTVSYRLFLAALSCMFLSLEGQSVSAHMNADFAPEMAAALPAAIRTAIAMAQAGSTPAAFAAWAATMSINSGE